MILTRAKRNLLKILYLFTPECNFCFLNAHTILYFRIDFRTDEIKRLKLWYCDPTSTNITSQWMVIYGPNCHNQKWYICVCVLVYTVTNDLQFTWTLPVTWGVCRTRTWPCATRHGCPWSFDLQWNTDQAPWVKWIICTLVCILSQNWSWSGGILVNCDCWSVRDWWNSTKYQLARRRWTAFSMFRLCQYNYAAFPHCTLV